MALETLKNQTNLENIVKCCLPIKDNVIISQGFFGKYSHKKIRPTTDFSYSIDFSVPLGTNVYAARDGVVRYAYDESSKFYEGLEIEEGKWAIPNVIEIIDNDGIITGYQHLEKGFKEKLGIRENMKIKKGDLIGITGLSGWIGNNHHLHFSIYKRFMQDNKNNTISIPFYFENYSGPLYDKDLNR